MSYTLAALGLALWTITQERTEDRATAAPDAQNPGASGGFVNGLNLHLRKPATVGRRGVPLE
jgi:hypothetical protein